MIMHAKFVFIVLFTFFSAHSFAQQDSAIKYKADRAMLYNKEEHSPFTKNTSTHLLRISKITLMFLLHTILLFLLRGN